MELATQPETNTLLRWSHVSEEFGIDMIKMLRTILELKYSSIPTQNEIEDIRARFSGYDELPDEVKRDIDLWIRSPQIKTIVDECEQFRPFMKPDEFYDLIVSRIYELQPVELKDEKIPREALRQTVANLGVIQVWRSAGVPKPVDVFNPSCIFFGEELATAYVKNHFYDLLSRVSLRDMKKEIELVTETVKTKIASPSLEMIVDSVALKCNEIAVFGERLHQMSGGMYKPASHQLIRIYETVKNGQKRALFYDATSAGKTLTAAIAAYMLREERANYSGNQGDKHNSSGNEHVRVQEHKTPKILLIAPEQALEDPWSIENWNEYARDFGFEPFKILKVNSRNYTQMSEHDVIEINYGKLSIKHSMPRQNKYFKAITDVIDEVDLLIVDECHNFRRYLANRTQAFVEIINKSKDKRCMLLSGTALPKDVSDMGFLSFMLDPNKYSEFATQPFVYPIHSHVIPQVMNSGAVFQFPREAVLELYSIPPPRFGVNELEINAVHKFEVNDAAAQRYFERWSQDDSGINAICDLSNILLRETIEQITDISSRIAIHNPDAQVLVFTRYVKGFVEPLKDALTSIYAPEQIGIITGHEKSVKNRVEMGRKFTSGNYRALICSEQTMSEAVPLTTNDKECYIILPQPTSVPAVYEQIPGRVLRKGQKGQVYIIELMPTTQSIQQRMIEHKKAMENEGVKYRENWEPKNVFENFWEMRESQSTRIALARQGKQIHDLPELLDKDGELFPEVCYSLPMRKEKKSKSPDQQFLDEINKARPSIGKGVEHLMSQGGIDGLISAYSREDLLDTVSGITNKSIAQIIYSLEKSSGEKFEDILDWGCGTGVLARIIGRPITNMDADSRMLQKAEEEIRKLEGLQPEIYANKNKANVFKKGDARRMPFDNASFDLVASTYALQYNAQGCPSQIIDSTEIRRDIEEILLETNRVLRLEKYGILALPNQATTQKDLDVLTSNLLPAYSFEVKMCEKVKGRAKEKSKANDKDKTKDVFSGYYLILFQKTGEAEGLHKNGSQASPIVFPPYKLIGTGGYKDLGRVVDLCGGKKEYGRIEFYVRDGDSLTDFVLKSIQGGNDDRR